ncbi:Aminoglycoside N3'-acetyltransferase [Dehalogenimonas alkenigignens]|uniref:Aminoglycoside N(3)-acetyltransferase n=1 Tax=Dehalogenimonas alkenigignens TaxID=1217799 RepID=A0A0W0GI09_9CHLR|nr:Aminoglycoside N3'-acetyltransferase [Dehalogenimonas alkenigignens]
MKGKKSSPLAETDRVKYNPLPLTVSSLTDDFRRIGVRPGMTLIVHSSLSSMGWVCGNAQSVIMALEAAIGETGTLVMPTHTSDNSDPAFWSRPPVPSQWWDIIRAETPAFDPELTPTRKMGAIPETFRKQPGTVRSNHPQVSFAARGPLAARIVSDHSLNYALGDASPLGRLYEIGGFILLLGVGYENNTALHLAEFRANFPGKKVERGGAAVNENGRRIWKILEDFSEESDRFPEIGAAFEAAHPHKVTTGRIGLAEARLMPVRDLVDFATAWLEANRK